MHTKRIHSRQRISSETSCRKSQRQAERIQANRFTLKQRARADLTLALFVSLRGVIKNTKRLSGSGPSGKRAYSSFIWKTRAGGGSERTTHTLNTHTHRHGDTSWFDLSWDSAIWLQSAPAEAFGLLCKTTVTTNFLYHFYLFCVHICTNKKHTWMWSTYEEDAVHTVSSWGHAFLRMSTDHPTKHKPGHFTCSLLNLFLYLLILLSLIHFNI